MMMHRKHATMIGLMVWCEQAPQGRDLRISDAMLMRIVRCVFVNDVGY